MQWKYAGSTNHLQTATKAVKCSAESTATCMYDRLVIKQASRLCDSCTHIWVHGTMVVVNAYL